MEAIVQIIFSGPLWLIVLKLLCLLLEIALLYFVYRIVVINRRYRHLSLENSGPQEQQEVNAVSLSEAYPRLNTLLQWLPNTLFGQNTYSPASLLSLYSFLALVGIGLTLLLIWIK